MTELETSSSGEAIREALERSVFASFQAQHMNRLLADAIDVSLPAGSTLYREEDQPRCALVISGLIRVFMTSPIGREVTVRYARSGDVLGIAATVGGPAPVSVQILTDSILVLFNVQTLRTIGQSDPEIGWLMAEEVTQRLYETLEALAGNVFGTVRQRVALHLLDLAASRQQGRQLVATVSQQELADAVGSVRTVVARAIRELRTAGLIETSADGIVLLDPAGLHAETWTRGL